eukprot:scaffold140408_cov41-Attheya_sp.AAC.1
MIFYRILIAGMTLNQRGRREHWNESINVIPSLSTTGPSILSDGCAAPDKAQLNCFDRSGSSWEVPSSTLVRTSMIDGPFFYCQDIFESPHVHYSSFQFYPWLEQLLCLSTPPLVHDTIIDLCISESIIVHQTKKVRTYVPSSLNTIQCCNTAIPPERHSKFHHCSVGS